MALGEVTKENEHLKEMENERNLVNNLNLFLFTFILPVNAFNFKELFFNLALTVSN